LDETDRGIAVGVSLPGAGCEGTGGFLSCCGCCGFCYREEGD